MSIEQQMNKIWWGKNDYLAGTISLFVNLFLFIIKLWLGMKIGSIALKTDAWHTISDSISSIILLVAIKLSSKKPDKEHPFGHGKWDQISSLFISFFLVHIAYNCFNSSIIRFHQRETIHFGSLAFVVTCLSVIIKEILAQYAFYVARETNNMTIKADGYHHRIDALSSLIVAIGILFSSYCWYIDSILGILTALLLFYTSCQIGNEAIFKLLGENPNPELLKKITDAIDPIYPHNLQLHHFQIHNYVTYQELILHIRLRNNLSIEIGHQIATNVEKIIYDQFSIKATVHIEPLDSQCLEN